MKSLTDKLEALKRAEDAAKANKNAANDALVKKLRDNYQTGLVSMAAEWAEFDVQMADLNNIAAILDTALTDRWNVIDGEKILKLGYGLQCPFAMLRVIRCHCDANGEKSAVERCDKMAGNVVKFCDMASDL